MQKKNNQVTAAAVYIKAPAWPRGVFNNKNTSPNRRRPSQEDTHTLTHSLVVHTRQGFDCALERVLSVPLRREGRVLRTRTTPTVIMDSTVCDWFHFRLVQRLVIVH